MQCSLLPFAQLFAFDQPNIAILYFPFVWLPSFIVMTVLFSHLISIRRLVKNKKINTAANGMQFEMHNI